MDEIKINIDNLRALRTKRRISLKEMAKMLGIHYNTYRYKEKGEIVMSLPEAKKISILLGESMDDIFFSF